MRNNTSCWAREFKQKKTFQKSLRTANRPTGHSETRVPCPVDGVAQPFCAVTRSDDVRSKDSADPCLGTEKLNMRGIEGLRGEVKWCLASPCLLEATLLPLQALPAHISGGRNC